MLPVTMLFVGYSWRARYGNSPWAGALEPVSSSLLYRGKKICALFPMHWGSLEIWGRGGAGVQILPPRAGNYLLARSSTSSSASSSQPFLTASGSSVSFSLGCEYQHTAELKLCPGYPAKHQRGGPREWYF